MSDDAMAFAIHSAVMHSFGRYWSPAGWLTHEEWAEFNDVGDQDAALMAELNDD
jgi:hypothetical protein